MKIYQVNNKFEINYLVCSKNCYDHASFFYKHIEVSFVLMKVFSCPSKVTNSFRGFRVL